VNPVFGKKFQRPASGASITNNAINLISRLAGKSLLKSLHRIICGGNSGYDKQQLFLLFLTQMLPVNAFPKCFASCEPSLELSTTFLANLRHDLLMSVTDATMSRIRRFNPALRLRSSIISSLALRFFAGLAAVAVASRSAAARGTAAGGRCLAQFPHGLFAA
jgi:hypothetical protein